MQSTLTLPLIVQLRDGLLSINEVLNQVILVAGVLGLAAAGAALTPFFALQLAVGVGALLAVRFLVDRAQLAWPSLSREDFRHLAFTALPVALAAIITAFYMRTLIVLASLLTSEYETGFSSPHLAHRDGRRPRASGLTCANAQTRVSGPTSRVSTMACG